MEIWLVETSGRRRSIGRLHAANVGLQLSTLFPLAWCEFRVKLLFGMARVCSACRDLESVLECPKSDHFVFPNEGVREVVPVVNRAAGVLDNFVRCARCVALLPRV